MFEPLLPLALAPATSSPSSAGSAAPAPAAPVAPAVPVAAPVTGGAAATQGAGTQAISTVDGTQPVAKPSALSSLMQLAPFGLLILVLYFVLFRGQGKTEKKRKAMIEEMKKGDTVMTIGGLIARVVAIDGDNVTLKIDESANVKAVYTKRSIQQVITDDDKAK